MVGMGRFELPTPCSQSRCASQTALHPEFLTSDQRGASHLGGVQAVRLIPAIQSDLPAGQSAACHGTRPLGRLPSYSEGIEVVSRWRPGRARRGASGAANIGQECRQARTPSNKVVVVAAGGARSQRW